MSDAEPIGTNDKHLVGMGGWLIVLAIGQVLGLVRILISLVDYFTKLDGNLLANFPIAVYGEAVMSIGLFAIAGYTTYLLFRKSRWFPRVFVYQYVVGILLYPIDVMFTALTMHGYTGAPVGTFAVAMMTPDDLWQWVIKIISAAIWIPYVKRSKRVANTFGR